MEQPATPPLGGQKKKSISVLDLATSLTPHTPRNLEVDQIQGSKTKFCIYF